tara:strand:- start:56 stop:682 length:627 start_codon:yes stop_codon:yes gene_type:complete
MDKLPDKNQFTARAVNEAICRLGLLEPNTERTLIKLLNNSEGEHPRALACTHRKEGSQLSDDEKRAAGIRQNAFMSQIAFNELTERGREDPIHAHELSLLRAQFSLFRYRTALSTREMMKRHRDHVGYIILKYDMFHQDTCACCQALNGKPVPDNWGLLPPESCECTTAPYGLRTEVDFIGAALAREENSAQSTGNRWMTSLRNIFPR